MGDRKIRIGLAALLVLAAVAVFGVVALADGDPDATRMDEDGWTGYAPIGEPIDPELAREFIEDPEAACDHLMKGLPDPPESESYWCTGVGINAGVPTDEAE